MRMVKVKKREGKRRIFFSKLFYDWQIKVNNSNKKLCLYYEVDSSACAESSHLKKVFKLLLLAS